MNLKKAKLYNLIFPIWLLWLIPVTWIIVLPANLLIDFTVIIITLRLMKLPDVLKKAKTVILKTWLFGFAADFIGTFLMYLSSATDFSLESLFGKWWYENITNAVAYYPFKSIYSILWITVSIIASSLFIYLFNYKFALKHLDISNSEKKKLALSLSIFTAPYLFFLPTSWFF